MKDGENRSASAAALQVFRRTKNLRMPVAAMNVTVTAELRAAYVLLPILVSVTDVKPIQPAYLCRDVSINLSLFLYIHAAQEEVLLYCIVSNAGGQ